MKPIRLRKPLEREIVAMILHRLQLNLHDWCWCRVEPASAVRARAYAGQPDKARKYSEDQFANGVSDIIGWGKKYFTDGKGLLRVQVYVVCFEVKRPGEKQRDSQIEFQERATIGGGLYAVIHSDEEAIAALKNWGLV